MATKICPMCKTEFPLAYPKDPKKFCSRRCNGQQPKPGRKMSPAGKARISEHRKRAYAEGRLTSIFTKGHEVPPEWREAARQANLGSARHTTPHTEETKQHIRKVKIAQLTEHERSRLRAMGLQGRTAAANRHRPTSIERQLYTYLTSRGCVYEPQVAIGQKWLVDAYLPDLNLVIEADGTYWHSTARAIETDRRKDDFIRGRGHRLLRIPERDFQTGKYIEILDEVVSPNREEAT